VRIGLFLAIYHDLSLQEALDEARALGCEAVEIATTGGHNDRDVAQLAASRGLTISALSCHGNPLHPDKEVAGAADRTFRETVRLAAASGVDALVTFSGCPGDSERSLRPSWVTCSWPEDYPETLEWQWRERVVPYWLEAAAFAHDQGVRVAIEPHPGFCVYNTASLLRLREAVGDTIGANFDPSHLFWQQIDPLASVRALSGAIYHVHAKDTGFDAGRLALNGVLETRTDPAERAWIFRSVGDGHPVAFWRDLAGALREAGYDGAMSIEHEDPLRTRQDGLETAVAALREALAPT
jgi:sugar phosphate isomerase/epimerase